jgi:hypothetical protein
VYTMHTCTSYKIVFRTHEVPVAPVPRLDCKIVWSEVQYLCSILKRHEIGSAVFHIGFSK